MRVKVLYIAGWGRSGTTIVDNILGAYDGVFSAGELYYLWARGLIERRQCGCGETLVACPVWRDVLSIAYRDAPPAPREFYDLQRRTIRVRGTRRLSRGNLRPDALRYRDEVARIYAALGTVTGADVIVDSSKTPAGAAVLTQCADVEPYLLHMIRDPRAVAHSWSRPTRQPDLAVPRDMPRHGAATSTTTWVAWNLLVEDLARNGYAGRSHRLRYEDFVADPQACMTDVLELVDVPATGSPFVDRSSVQLAANHTVGGNPGRFRTGTIAITPDNRWHSEQSRGRRTVSTAIALPLLRRYGYPVAVGAPPQPTRNGSTTRANG